MARISRKIPPLFLVLGLALLVRLVWVLITPAIPIQDYKDYLELAVRLADGQGYVNTAGPTTFRPPGYPFALAGLFVLFGKSLLAVKLFNTLLGGLTAYLTYACARRVFDQPTALAAALITALMPNLVFFTGLVASENLSTPLFLLGLALFLKADQEERPVFFWLAGLVLGLVTLTRPTNLYPSLLLPLFLLLKKFLAHRWAFRRWSAGRLALSAALLWSGLILVLLPWTVRNYRVSGHFIPTVSSGGMALLMSFSEEYSPTFAPVVMTRLMGAEYDWTTNRFTGLDLDEYEIDQKFQRAAIETMRRHPLRFAALAPTKLYYLLRDSVSGAYDNLFDDSGQYLLPRSQWFLFRLLQVIAQGYYLLLMLLMLVGLFQKRLFARFPDALLILALILYLIAIHTLINGADRYHLPYVPFFSMFSAVGLLWLLRRFAARRQAAQPVLLPR